MDNEEKEVQEETIPNVASEDTNEPAETKEEPAENSESEETSVDHESAPTLEEELTESKDKYLRLYSEFENFRRRTSKERLDLISTANKDLMSDILPVLDDLDRAMNAEKEDLDSFKEGVGLIQQKLTKSLEQKGLKKMDVKKGDKFDDEKQEAITQIPVEKKLEGKVVDVIEAGYTLGEAVVRFAKVVVGAKQ